MAMKNPVHPGRIVKGLINELNLMNYDLAQVEQRADTIIVNPIQSHPAL